jgi:hypothetical protein
LPGLLCRYEVIFIFYEVAKNRYDFGQKTSFLATIMRL